MKYVGLTLAAIAAVYVVYLVAPAHKTCGFFDWIFQKCG